MTSALRSVVRRSKRVAWLRRVRLNVVARTGAHQDFRPFVRTDERAWQHVLSEAQRGQRVVIASNIGGHFGLAAIDRLLAVALTMRGANVTAVLCDRALPACQMCEVGLVPDERGLVRRGPPRSLCSYCYGPARQQITNLDLPCVTIGSSLRDEDRRLAAELAATTPADDIRRFIWRDLPVGEHALAGALRYYARGELTGEADGEGILRRFLQATILTALAYGRLFDELRPEVVVAHHGIYVPQGIVASLARQRGIRVVTWNPAYRKHCFIFSHDATYHHTLMTEPVAFWRDTPLTSAQRQEIETYLKSRWQGREDWIRFHRDPDMRITADLTALGIASDKPLVVALTNVFWDAQLHYPANAFSSQREWLIETIRWFSNRPDLHLAIRIHPAEASGSPPSRQRAEDEIRRAFQTLPNNVTVIPPESALSTYALAAKADAAIIYATKMGVELTGVGIPVIVAGEAWVRNKGFTYDVASRDDYLQWLARLPFGSRLSSEMREKALQYAHHFFFGRMIPIPFVRPEPGPRRFTIAADNLGMLTEGQAPGLDVICRGILTGSPFIMPRM